MSSPQSFQINVPESHVSLLKQQLSFATFPSELSKAGWDLGPPLADIKRLTKAWQAWDWKTAERKLNESLPQFHVDIEVEGFGGLDVHFVHQRSAVERAVPLLFVHGWPGSFIEVQRILPLLAQQNEDIPAFHIIAPSLPNFGFSQSIPTRGFALTHYAETCHKLMLKLGFPQYVTQAGDWGFWITRAMGRLYPQSCRASHLNMVYARPPDQVKTPAIKERIEGVDVSEADRKALKRREWFQKEGRGYNVLQSTKPQTLSYALTDSPVALLAWIYEKLHDWTDHYPWTADEILTWVSIYYFSRAGPGAAHRIYYEVFHDEEGCGYEDCQDFNGEVKLGLTFNPKELDCVPKGWGRGLGDVVYEVVNEKGGHFYAHEHPELLVRDVRAMFGKGGGAYGVVPGKDGY